MKENKKGYTRCQRALALLLVAVLTLGVLPVQSRAAATENYPVDHISTVADAQPIGHPGTVYGKSNFQSKG